MNIQIQTTALVIVDVQRDFCPSYTDPQGRTSPPGALAVEEGDLIIPQVNYLARAVAAGGGLVVATQDWHPPLHISFASSHSGHELFETLSIPVPNRTGETLDQTLWPDHCVQGTFGADLHPLVDQGPLRYIVRKGIHQAVDSYSAFYENDQITPTGLEALLTFFHIEVLLLCGLATDYCVQYSALDALKLGYTTVVVEDACRPVQQDTGLLALDRIRQGGGTILGSDKLKL